MRVGEPAADWYSVLRVEDIACWRVVDNDGLLQFAANLTEVLDIVALMIITRLTEESVVYRTGDIELIEQRISVFRNRSGENNNFVKLANTLEKGVYTWPLDNINIVILPLNFDRDCKVCLVQNLRASAWSSYERLCFIP